MSIKISDIKNIQKEYKNYLERYFEQGSEKYKEATKEFENNQNGLIGFSGENTVVKFAVVINPENNTFIYSSNDKYNESQIKNFKEAKNEVNNFLSKIVSSLGNELESLEQNNTINKEDKGIMSLLNTIDASGVVVEYDNDLINLDFHNVDNYKIDKDNPIVTTKNLFSSFEIMDKITLSELKNLFSDIMTNNNTINNFNQTILNSVASIYPDNNVSNDNTKQTVERDFGINLRPSF